MKSHRYKLKREPQPRTTEHEEIKAASEYEKAILKQEAKISQMLNPEKNKLHQEKVHTFD